MLLSVLAMDAEDSCYVAQWMDSCSLQVWRHPSMCKAEANCKHLKMKP